MRERPWRAKLELAGVAEPELLTLFCAMEIRGFIISTALFLHAI